MAERAPRMLPDEILADYLLGGLGWCGIRSPEGGQAGHLPEGGQTGHLPGGERTGRLPGRGQTGRLPSPGEQAVDRALEIYGRVVAHGFFHVPSFLVVDLLLLLERGFEAAFASDLELADWSDEKKTLRLRYEREILGRTLQAPGLDELLEILRHSPDAGAQTERLLVLLLETLGPHVPRRAVVNPALVRALHRSSGNGGPAAEHEARFLEWLGEERYFHRLLGDFLDSAAQHVHWSRLIHEEDVFELTHWRSLSTEHLRIGCRQILAVDRRLAERALPQRVHVHDAGDVETAFVDEVYALVISADRAEHWLAPDDLTLARDGMPWPELADLRARIVTRLVG